MYYEFCEPRPRHTRCGVARGLLGLGPGRRGLLLRQGRRLRPFGRPLLQPGRRQAWRGRREDCWSGSWHAHGVQNQVVGIVCESRINALPYPFGSNVGFGWMVVRFVRVIRVPACARVSRVSRVCPGSPRCLFTVFLPVLYSTTRIFIEVAKNPSRTLGAHTRHLPWVPASASRRKWWCLRRACACFRVPRP